MIRLARPSFDKKSILKINKVFKSGFLTQGHNVSLLEKNLKNYLKVKNVVVVSSGTAALHLSLLALGLKKNDEIIIPSFSFIATANVIELVGAKVKFVDINLKDCCIDVNKIEQSINSKTKAIIPVHEFGNPAEMDKIKKIAKKNNLFIIEDSACGIGSSYKKKKLGTIGDVGCFSFHPRKLLTTGEGGIVVTNNNKLSNKIRSLSNHGISLVNNKKIFSSVGLNYRMTDFQAVLGLDQLKKINKIINYKIKIAKLYKKYLSDIDWIALPEIKLFTKTNFQSFHIILDKRINRDLLIEYLKKNHIETNYGAQAIHVQKYYKKKYKFSNISYPNSYYAYKKGLVLPIGLHVSENDIKKISKIISLF